MRKEEIDKLIDIKSEEKKAGKIYLTEEQYYLLIKAKEVKPPLSNRQIAEMWEEMGWGEITVNRVNYIYMRIKENRYKVIKKKKGDKNEV